MNLDDTTMGSDTILTRLILTRRRERATTRAVHPDQALEIQRHTTEPEAQLTAACGQHRTLGKSTFGHTDITHR